MNELGSLLHIDMSATDPQDSAIDEVCFRHPDRPSGVSCQRCGNLVCGECMHQASVGVHCPDCTKSNKQKVFNTRNLPGQNAMVTKVLIGLNVAWFILAIPLFDADLFQVGTLAREFGTFGPPIAENNEFFRIITGGFGHFGLIHLGVNMFSLWVLGRTLEARMGPKLFLFAYMVSLIGGSFGALLISPRATTMGASGAIFGLLGLMVLALRSRGIGLQESGLGRILLLNLFISFSGFVSLGGHAGGFLAGLGLGAIYFGVNPGDGPMLGGDEKKHLAISVLIGIVLFVASIWAAGTWQAPLFGDGV